MARNSPHTVTWLRTSTLAALALCAAGRAALADASSSTCERPKRASLDVDVAALMPGALEPFWGDSNSETTLQHEHTTGGGGVEGDQDFQDDALFEDEEVHHQNGRMHEEIDDHFESGDIDRYEGRKGESYEDGSQSFTDKKRGVRYTPPPVRVKGASFLRGGRTAAQAGKKVGGDRESAGHFRSNPEAGVHGTIENAESPDASEEGVRIVVRDERKGVSENVDSGAEEHGEVGGEWEGSAADGVDAVSDFETHEETGLVDDWDAETVASRRLQWQGFREARGLLQLDEDDGEWAWE